MVERIDLEHLQIRHLVDTYTDAVNRHDWKAVEQVFAADARWRVEGIPEFDFSGAENIAKSISQLLSNYATLVQMVHSCIPKIDGDLATANTTVHEIAFLPDGSKIFDCLGLYEDRAVKRDGRWRFSARTFHIITREERPYTGAVSPVSGPIFPNEPL